MAAAVIVSQPDKLFDVLDAISKKLLPYINNVNDIKWYKKSEHFAGLMNLASSLIESPAFGSIMMECDSGLSLLIGMWITSKSGWSSSSLSKKDWVCSRLIDNLKVRSRSAAYHPMDSDFVKATIPKEIVEIPLKLNFPIHQVVNKDDQFCGGVDPLIVCFKDPKFSLSGSSYFVFNVQNTREKPWELLNTDFIKLYKIYAVMCAEIAENVDQASIYSGPLKYPRASVFVGFVDELVIPITGWSSNYARESIFKQDYMNRKPGICVNTSEWPKISNPNQLNAEAMYNHCRSLRNVAPPVNSAYVNLPDGPISFR